jgi:hypothetical protein
MLWIVVSAAQAGQTFHVSGFGAVGDGIHDDGPAIRRALAAAVQAGPGSRVQFDRKPYRLEEYMERDYQFELAGVNGLSMDGCGALLINTPTNNLFRLSGCRGVTVNGFVVDYDPLPFTQGTVTRVDAASGVFDLALHTGYALPPEDAEVKRRFGESGWQWGSVIDPQERHRRWDVQMHFFIQSVEAVEGDERLRRVTVTPPFRKALAPVRPGDRFFLPLPWARSGGRGGYLGTNFSVTACTDCRIEDVTFYSARSGMVFGVSHNEGPIRLRGLQVRFKPGTDRVCTTWRDGIHSKDNRVGPVIEDCYFEGMLDDSINMGANTAMAREVRSGTEFDLMGAPFRTEDEVLVWDPVTGRTLAKTTVAGVRRDRGGVVVTLLDEVAGVVTGCKRPHTDIASTHFYNLSRCGRGFVIRNCTFKPQRRHAMLVRAPEGLIENNRVDGVGGSAVVLGNEMGSFYEGPFPNNTVVRNNTIGYTQQAAIRAYTQTRAGTAEITHGVQIRNNRITVLPGRKGIDVTHVRDAVVEGNTVETASVRKEGMLVHGSLTGRILATGSGRILLLDRTGAILWQHPGQNCSDVWMLENGNVLHADNNVTEIDPKTNEIVWSYRPAQQQGGATFSCQRLANGRTVVGENSAGRIVEVDREGQVVFELKLPLMQPGSHNNLRMVRKLKNGHYLVCHKDKSLVREYTPQGEVVFEVKVSDVPFSAVRLDNGHTVVGHINRITEFDRRGEAVWQFDKSELPGLEIGMICGVHVQPNGNIVMGLYRAVQKENGAGLLEITRDKEIVWRYVNTSDKPDRNMMGVQLLDEYGKPLPGEVLR